MSESIDLLDKVKGARVVKIGRACDVIWISFKDCENVEYALHIQSFFRFCDCERILITGMDKFQPIESLAELDDFNWDVQGNNQFDQWCNHFNRNELENTFVESVQMSSYGDLSIQLSNVVTLSVYVDTTSEDESWRIFIPKSKTKHYVVTGKGMGEE